jgi:RIO kinase 1
MRRADISASPRLKDAKIPDGRLPKLYAELLVTVRRMFQDCRLVHADLSEYNILYVWRARLALTCSYHASHLYIIDVSQSVEHDHPRAFDFLRSDLHNVEEFFGKHSVPTLGIRRVWDFVTSETVAGITRGDENGVEGEGRLMEVVRCWLENTLKQDLALSYGGLGTSSGAPDVGNEDAVFKSSYIPRNLGDVYDPERDIEVVNAGRADTLIYARLTGLEESTQVPIVHRSSTDGEHGDEGSSGEEQTCTGTDSGDEASAPLPGSRSRGFRHEDKNARKVGPGCPYEIRLADADRSGRRPSRRRSGRGASRRCPSPKSRS